MATSVDTPGALPQLPLLLTQQNIRADYMDEMNPIIGCLALARDIHGERPLEEVFYELLAETAERAGGASWSGFLHEYKANIPNMRMPFSHNRILM